MYGNPRSSSISVARPFGNAASPSFSSPLHLARAIASAHNLLDNSSGDIGTGEVACAPQNSISNTRLRYPYALSIEPVLVCNARTIASWRQRSHQRGRSGRPDPQRVGRQFGECCRQDLTAMLSRNAAECARHSAEVIEPGIESFSCHGCSCS